MLNIIRYNASHQSVWDAFAATSKCATFLHQRGYMEYHADRFCDHSLLLYKEEKLVALLPANEADGVLYSHQGLTYGGWLLSSKATAQLVLELFDALVAYLRQRGFERLVYKPLPAIYHSYPAQEDLYALFRVGAELTARNLSSTIDLAQPLRFSELRRRGIKRAVREGLTVVNGGALAPFWELLTLNLQSRYGVNPVHTLEEIAELQSRFPQEIVLHTVCSSSGEVVAGCVVYDTPMVAHAQYISASTSGKASGALDLLFDQLIHHTYAKRRFFDFGQSTEQEGRYLNEGLIAQKEGFGGRGTLYDRYEIVL